MHTLVCLISRRVIPKYSWILFTCVYTASISPGICSYIAQSWFRISIDMCSLALHFMDWIHYNEQHTKYHGETWTFYTTGFTRLLIYWSHREKQHSDLHNNKHICWNTSDFSFCSKPWASYQIRKIVGHRWFANYQWASCQIRKIAGCTYTGNAGNIFIATAG